MAPPYVVKPNDEGSSVGVYIVHEAANGPPQLSDKMPARVMVETYAPGRELTVAVLGDRALGVTEIVTEAGMTTTPNTRPAALATSSRPTSPRKSPPPAAIMRCRRIGRWGAAG